MRSFLGALVLVVGVASCSSSGPTTVTGTGGSGPTTVTGTGATNEPAYPAPTATPFISSAPPPTPTPPPPSHTLPTPKPTIS